MIEPHWKRIAGMHVKKNGDIACVWLAHDPETDCIHVYESCLFRNQEVFAVVVEALNVRGRWIPVAWNDKPTSDKLLDRGCNMLPEQADDSPAMAASISREIFGRMDSNRWKVDKRLGQWVEEVKTYNRDGDDVPTASHPLMAATRHAVEKLEFARRLRPKGKKQAMYPSLAVI